MMGGGRPLILRRCQRNDLFTSTFHKRLQPIHSINLIFLFDVLCIGFILRMKKVKTILTHPGGAHKDDFLACCLMLATCPAPIVRRNPTENELSDPEICVIDIGGLHDPEMMNFDHHQLPREHPPTCSVSLILQELGVYEDAKRFCDWLEPTEWFDCRGPVKTADWLGVDRDVLNKLNSPIDVTVLRRFAYSEFLGPGDIIWELMKMIGEDLMNYICSLRERLQYLMKTCEIWEVADERKVVVLPKSDNMPSEPSLGMGRFVEMNEISEQVIALVYPDRRGNGYALSRYNDYPQLDFSQLEAEGDVVFCHTQGFLAKTSATSNERILELIKMANV